MDWNRVEGNWKQVKGKVKEQWGQLTDDDSISLMASASSSRARSKSATASKRTASAGMWTTGITARLGKPRTGKGPDGAFLLLRQMPGSAVPAPLDPSSQACVPRR